MGDGAGKSKSGFQQRTPGPPKKVMEVGVGAVEKEKEDLPRTLLKAVEGWMVL